MENTIVRKRIAFIGTVTAVAFAGCSSSGTNPQPVTAVNPLQGKLQVAVGTANLFGGTAAAATGLNVVSSFRQVSGQQSVGLSETLVNSPTLTGPMTLPAQTGTADDYGATIVTGPTAAEQSSATMTSTPQIDALATTIPATTFGVSNGVFSSGIEPFNETVVSGAGAQPAGEPITYVPNVVPVYDPVSSDLNAFIPWGGPPSFDPNGTGRGTRDGNGEPSSVLGVEEGLDVFEGVVGRTGTYTLKVVIPTSSTSNGSVSASAALATTTELPNAVPPAAVTLDGNGGGSLAVVLPAGVTEAYVQIVDLGPTAMGAVSCNGSSASLPAYYTIETTTSGTVTLPDAIGPVGKPSASNPTLCTAAQNTTATGGASDGDAFSVQLVGFDYPAYESSALKAKNNPAPTLTGANGQSDITVSPAVVFDQATGSAGAQTVAPMSATAGGQVLRTFSRTRINVRR